MGDLPDVWAPADQGGGNILGPAASAACYVKPGLDLGPL